jgi:hypothetical protein
MVGEDRYEGFKKWMEHLGKRMKNPNYPGYDHVVFEVESIPRSEVNGGNSMSFTQLRKILSAPISEEEKLNAWCNGFNEKKLGRAWIKELMDVSKANMGIMESVKNPKDIVTFDIPLLIRMLEYAREDAKTDMDLHNVVERLIDMSADGKTLTMDEYNSIVSPKLNEAIAVFEKIEKFEKQMSNLRMLSESLTR